MFRIGNYGPKKNIRYRAMFNIKHRDIFEKACLVSASVDVQPTKPSLTLTVRQQHRSNADTEDGSVEEYYRVNLTVPFLDHLLNQFRLRYSNLYERMLS